MDNVVKSYKISSVPPVVQDVVGLQIIGMKVGSLILMNSFPFDSKIKMNYEIV